MLCAEKSVWLKKSLTGAHCVLVSLLLVARLNQETHAGEAGNA